MVVRPAWLPLGAALLCACQGSGPLPKDGPPAADASAAPADSAAPAAAATAGADGGGPCLPQRSTDLSDLIMGQPLAPRSGTPQMVPVPRGSSAWNAGRDAARAWAAADCPRFLTAAQAMGYDAAEVLDTATGR